MEKSVSMPVKSALQVGITERIEKLTVCHSLYDVAKNGGQTNFPLTGFFYLKVATQKSKHLQVSGKLHEYKGNMTTNVLLWHQAAAENRAFHVLPLSI